MSVDICVLGSGSGGNCTYIGTPKTRLLVDAGFSMKETARRLATIQVPLESIQAIVISHEHADHIHGVETLVKNLNIPVFIAPAAFEASRISRNKYPVEPIRAEECFTVGDIRVQPFAIPHDSVEPLAFCVVAEGIKTSIVTDLGYIPELVKQRVAGSHCLVFESNHDLEMLKVGPYPWFVKQRVMSRHGHLSNDTTAQFFAEDYDGQAVHVLLAHISQKNNHPEIVRMSMVQVFESRGLPPEKIQLTHQDEPAPLLRF
ncbi:MAG: MBL fold metallo-hydrolase [Acidobacteriia bacterium]|nr:MBL fold metallo-hydrolase [Terriglobia bacterium]